MSTWPLRVILILSVGELELSAVVPNVRRPGISFELGAASTCAFIYAPRVCKSLPSWPQKTILPKSSPSWTIPPFLDLPIAMPPAPVEFCLLWHPNWNPSSFSACTVQPTVAPIFIVTVRPINNRPLLSRRIRVVTFDVPLLVVAKSIQVGWLTPEVQEPPSRLATICAAVLWLWSPNDTTPRASVSAGFVEPFISLMIP